MYANIKQTYITADVLCHTFCKDSVHEKDKTFLIKSVFTEK